MKLLCLRVSFRFLAWHVFLKNFWQFQKIINLCLTNLGTIIYLELQIIFRNQIHITICKYQHKIFNVFIFLLYKIFEDQINHRGMFPRSLKVEVLCCSCNYYFFLSMAKWMDKQQWGRTHNGKSFCPTGMKYKLLSCMNKLKTKKSLDVFSKLWKLELLMVVVFLQMFFSC